MNNFHRISSKFFTYTQDPSGFGGVFTIEHSELDALGGLKPHAQNNATIGFTMVSARTGLTADFVLTNMLFNDSEVIGCLLQPTFSSYNQPGGHRLKHVTVKVFNT